MAQILNLPVVRRTYHPSSVDPFVEWYFEHLWQGRLLVTLPLATLITFVEFELIARAVLKVFS